MVAGALRLKPERPRRPLHRPVAAALLVRLSSLETSRCAGFWRWSSMPTRGRSLVRYRHAKGRCPEPLDRRFERSTRGRRQMRRGDAALGRGGGRQGRPTRGGGGGGGARRGWVAAAAEARGQEAAQPWGRDGWHRRQGWMEVGAG